MQQCGVVESTHVESSRCGLIGRFMACKSRLEDDCKSGAIRYVLFRHTPWQESRYSPLKLPYCGKCYALGKIVTMRLQFSDYGVSLATKP